MMLDQRGHGASDGGRGPQLGPATDDLLFVLDHLGPFHAVVGHSYGALVAHEAARQATSEQIPRLAVYEPPLSLDGPIMDRQRLAQVSSAVAAGEFEAALRLHLESPIGGMSEAEAEAFANDSMLRSAFADLVVQAPSIVPALESVIHLGRRRAVPQDRRPDAAPPRQRQRRRPVPSDDRRAGRGHPRLTGRPAGRPDPHGDPVRAPPRRRRTEPVPDRDLMTRRHLLVMVTVLETTVRPDTTSDVIALRTVWAPRDVPRICSE